MSRIKEYYHEEICGMQNADDMVDDTIQFEQWKLQQAQLHANRFAVEWELQQEANVEIDEQIDKLAEQMKKDQENSELPSFLF